MQPDPSSGPATATHPEPVRPREGGRGLPVNWSLAATTATKLMPPGPQTSPEAARELVERLRADSARAEGHVREVTGMGAGLPLLPADVLDRSAWARAAVEGMDALTSGAEMPASPRALRAVTAAGSGVQLGALIAYMGARVLGQYDPFGGPGGAGRLIVVAPNVHAATGALGVDGDQFGLWVCLHEATHRLQFTAVPWLRDHFAGLVTTLLSLQEPDPARLTRLPEAIRALRGEDGRRGDVLALVELLQGPEQRAVLDRLLALSTLLEGHADHVMDAVGPDVVPDVAVIRRRFTERRRGAGFVDRLLRALLGVEAKMRQYAIGAAFCREVEREAGMAGLNRAWESPETLPTRAELTDAPAWLRRVG
ncbi:zinc-dependent metalloprotease [Pseudonocardia sp. C8]|uniref:zinc-dependent metalloprotease n=1 Tax=Pseudonocardia sp. C8 TaxID=2762759 RepID=UPI001642C452|nr:zinc-dependent metalloprotease [Pseudonocardia sp. C8]MBC3194799.1 zinc-dependent metalloprotease [Pseudonocardia sp. C8]